jgi:spermidine synthase
VELAGLYSREFYTLAAARLAPGGLLVTQASSPFFARRAYWCIVHTLESASLHVYPYRSVVPAFGGEWGFALASPMPLEGRRVQVTVPTRYLTGEMAGSLFLLPRDFGELRTRTSTLTHPHILEYYEDASWEK